MKMVRDSETLMNSKPAAWRNNLKEYITQNNNVIKIELKII
jgi:hypothetical protein